MCLTASKAEMIETVPPPFLPFLIENTELWFGGEASVRTAGASEPSHVSAENQQSVLSKIELLSKSEGVKVPR